MWLIVGLGNPGSKYARTRHNVGFMVLEELGERHGFSFSERKDFRIAGGSIGGVGCTLLEPLTFMNRSGAAVKKVMEKVSAPMERLIVIHDDLDLDTGRVKIRRRGSSGGHRGVESVIQSIGAREFVRVKIGIGRDPFLPVEAYVLSRFAREEAPLLREAIKKAADSIESILADGIDRTMNRFN